MGRRERPFSLPYIDAIIMESMRLHPIATLLAPHYAMEDCKVAGYDIAKGTAVLINTWSLGRDPNSWDSPFEFLPERFLDKDIDIMEVIFPYCHLDQAGGDALDMLSGLRLSELH
ncbi:UNVERIFIED_CONTAM: cytochrome [Sesamum radiatum]|uniref:Cytochrome n=1 Tax=Sesamum radiatum TaxID=300843 RepID=A0AAW2P4S2_SESRA